MDSPAVVPPVQVGGTCCHARLQPHYADFWIGPALFSLGWLLIGVGLFALCKRLAKAETGWKSSIDVGGTIMLVAFAMQAVIYLNPQAWAQSAEIVTMRELLR